MMCSNFHPFTISANKTNKFAWVTYAINGWNDETESDHDDIITRLGKRYR
ncbi:hypothetical protein VspSTUT11_32710 [Vibrio sp. STUT-A11]|nr:hypothetical protein VspSTUT11_32710 [Vibrio sp. STUT-A11]